MLPRCWTITTTSFTAAKLTMDQMASVARAIARNPHGLVLPVKDQLEAKNMEPTDGYRTPPLLPFQQEPKPYSP
jgi:hypothetical protein